MKKSYIATTVFAILATVLVGCSQAAPTEPVSSVSPAPAEPVSEAPATPAPTSASEAPSFDTGEYISVVSREEGSGTRGAFIELFGILAEGDDGSEKDMTTEEAVIADRTDIMLTNVANDEYAAGYMSVGTLNSTVKALAIEGVAATLDNIKNGTYAIQRPFNLATKGQLDGLGKDFIDYILSKEGQAVAEENGYLSTDDAAPAYAGTKPEGSIVVAGSSSVTPLMEKLVEAYKVINPAATIQIQMTDSSAGMTSTIDGSCDIGMASRALKDTELAELTEIEIAIDGIAVIVSNDNPIESVTTEQVKGIFTGELETWSDVQ